jgi:acetylornithine deacetylase/succinyl-diaminopimelate desuccinylase
MTNHIEQVLKQIDKNELITLLQQAIRIPSHIEIPDQEKEIGDFMAQRLRAEGIDTELQLVEGLRPNVIAVIKGSGKAPSVTFNGHIDSVPPFDMENPYSGEVKDGKIYGRGACDCKGGIISMMYAMIAIKRSGIIPPGDIVLSAVAGEEYGSYGARHYVANNRLPEYGICGEATDQQIQNGHKGLHWFEFHFPGKRAHSSVPEKGINAIDRLAHFMKLVEEQLKPQLETRKHGKFSPSLVNIGKVWGGEQPNVTPGEAWLQLERRYIPGETLESVTAELQQIVDQCNVYGKEYDITFTSMPYSLRVSKTPFEVPETHPIVQALIAANEKVLGTKPEIGICPGWGDAGVLYDHGVPTVYFGPGSGQFAHSPQEHVPIDELYNAAKVYAIAPFMLDETTIDTNNK